MYLIRFRVEAFSGIRPLIEKRSKYIGMSLAGDILGRLSDGLEAYPAMRKLFAGIYLRLRPGFEGLGLSLPRHIPSGLRRLRQVLQESTKTGSTPCQGPKVLVVSPRGWATALLVDTLLAQSMRLRGAEVTVWTCGNPMPVCHITNKNEAPPMPCHGCMQLQDDLLKVSDFRRIKTSDYVDREFLGAIEGEVNGLDRRSILARERDGIFLGEIAEDALRWFSLTADIDESPSSLGLLRDFLVLGESTVHAGRLALEELEPDVVLMINGIFTEERIIRNLCQQRRIPFVNYERAFGFNHFVFSRNQLANHYDLTEHWGATKNVPLSENEETHLNDFLRNWKKGEGTVVKYWDDPEERDEIIKEQLGVSADKRILTMFTNVVWDTAAFGRDVAFEGMWDWIASTIGMMDSQTDDHLVIRVHPAEVKLEGRETDDSVFDRIKREFDELPANVSVIPPDSPISSYRLMALSDMILVYTSTIGLEAAIAGKPVVVAGDTHYRCKGFTYDPAFRDEYFRLLSRGSIQAWDQSQISVLARRYAHLFFLRYMYPLPMIDERVMGNPRLNIDSVAELEPGNCHELDQLCEFILNSAGNLDPAALITT